MYFTKPLTHLTGNFNTVNTKLDSTPKTDPKLNSKPFRNLTFYLDILNSVSCQQKLTQEIEALGGIVETFLGKNVNYFVTNRRTGNPNNNSSGTPSSFTSMSRSSAMTADSPWTIEPSRCNNIIRKAVKSRADTLIEKAQKSVPVKYKGDVLQMASTLGIKIINLSKFNIWVKSLKSKCKLDITPSSKKGMSKFKFGHSSKTRLVLPFLKYEDYERSFCPQYRQLQEWPKLYFNDDCETSPFRRTSNKKNLKSLTPIPRSPLKLLQSKSFMSPRKLNNTTDIHKNLNFDCQTELQKKPGYCDICSVRYTNINEHIVDNKHKSVVGESGFFSKLDAFISTLPTLQQLRDKYSTSNNNCKIRSTPPRCKTSENIPMQIDSKGHFRGSEFGTPRKKRKLDSGVGLMSFTDHINTNVPVEDKENLKGEIEGNVVIRTPQKIPFQMRRNGFQQNLENATFCNPDISLHDLESNANCAATEGESLCILKSTPSRLLRSTSHRRTVSSNTSGDLSGNSPTAIGQHALSKDTLSVFNYDADSTTCNSLWNQFEPLNLSTKLSLESLMMESENLDTLKNQSKDVVSNFIPEFDSRPISPRPVIEATCVPIPDNDQVDLQTALENFSQSFVVDEETKEEDKSWDSAIDSFISTKLKSIQSECDGMNISANASTFVT